MEDDTEDEYLPSEEEGVLSAKEAENLVTDEGIPDSAKSQTTTRYSSTVNQVPRPKTTSKKRKPEIQDDAECRYKRSRKFYSDGYRRLLNDVIYDAATASERHDSVQLPSSQIGITLWSPEEKEKLLCGLSRKGRINVHAIASAVGTKSVPEVDVYVRLLHQAMLDQHLQERHHGMLGFAEIPAAFEIGSECTVALDEAADALSTLQRHGEEEIERKKHGKLWLLDESTADLLDNDDGEIEPEEMVPAFEVLDLKRFLELSRRIFMNSKNLEENWISYAAQDEAPSIMCTTFLDFYSLVVSITRRLVQSSIFFALSRIKATDSSSYTHRRAVKKNDISVALKVLGVPVDSRRFWTGVARRGNLNVYEKIRTNKETRTRLQYDEVERLLCQASEREGTSSVAISDEEAVVPSQVDSSGSSSSDEEPMHEDYDVESVPYDDPSDMSGNEFSFRHLHYNSAKHRAKSAERLEKDQDTYADALDHQASLEEEQRLWKILRRKPPQKIKPEDIELPNRPNTERKVKEDLTDWRDWVDYRSEWETYETPVPAESFERNRRLRKRLNTAARMHPREKRTRSTIHPENSQGGGVGEPSSSRANESSGTEQEDRSDRRNTDLDEQSIRVDGELDPVSDEEDLEQSSDDDDSVDSQSEVASVDRHQTDLVEGQSAAAQSQTSGSPMAVSGTESDAESD
ncbi:hypothetical protein MMC24_004310 [Lignoscripta atroalba]|nr:hypothetical protein [Lignoscripta atroalba]